jgi:hypothetical protein
MSVTTPHHTQRFVTALARKDLQWHSPLGQPDPRHITRPSDSSEVGKETSETGWLLFHSWWHDQTACYTDAFNTRATNTQGTYNHCFIHWLCPAHHLRNRTNVDFSAINLFKEKIRSTYKWDRPAGFRY